MKRIRNFLIRWSLYIALTAACIIAGGCGFLVALHNGTKGNGLSILSLVLVALYYAVVWIKDGVKKAREK